MLNSLQSALLLVVFISIIIKIILWSRLSIGRPPFLLTLFSWASVHDIHNAESAKSKLFFKTNNTINIIIWICLILFAFSYFGNDQIIDKPPKFDPKAIF